MQDDFFERVLSLDIFDLRGDVLEDILSARRGIVGAACVEIPLSIQLKCLCGRCLRYKHQTR